MATPSRRSGREGANCHLSGCRTLSKSLRKSQPLPVGNGPVIVLDGTTVRIVGGDDVGVPRRQGFAWARDAEDYAARLSAERGWPIDENRG